MTERQEKICDFPNNPTLLHMKQFSLISILTYRLDNNKLSTNTELISSMNQRIAIQVVIPMTNEKLTVTAND